MPILMCVCFPLLLRIPTVSPAVLKGNAAFLEIICFNMNIYDIETSTA